MHVEMRLLSSIRPYENNPRLNDAAVDAVKTLLELQKASAPFAVRLGAARAVLEIGTKLREAADLEERLAALEQQLVDTSA